MATDAPSMIRCECPARRRITPLDVFQSDPQEPTPQSHEPGECPGRHDLRLVVGDDGVSRWLCSWCW